MQYAITRRLSAVHFGLPQKFSDVVSCLKSEPSGFTMNICASCRRSHRPCANGAGRPRPDVNAIHLPSADHDGRKSPPGPDVNGFTLRVVRSIVQRVAVPAVRVLTKTSCLPSGENAA